MSYYQKLPDHIPFRANAQEFFFTLKNLSESSPDTHLYADRNGLQTVSTVQMIFQKIIGFFGGKDHTSIPNVEMTLAKFLSYGQAQGFTRHENFKPWIKLLKARVEDIPFSTNMRELMTTLEKGKGDLKDHLISIHARYGSEIDALGGKTKVEHGSHPTFGKTPIILAELSLRKGAYGEAIHHAENGYRLGRDYEAIGTIFLQIGEKIPHRNIRVSERLIEFRDHALKNGNDTRALRFEKALQKVAPEASTPLNAKMLLRFANAAKALGNAPEALAYYERAQTAGISRGEIQIEKLELYTSLYEKAQRENSSIDALKYYELALEYGLPKDGKKLGDLYLKAAQSSLLTESQKSGRRVVKNFAEAVNLFEKGIDTFKESKTIHAKLFDGNWVSSYLEALKQHGQLERGISFVTTFADAYGEISKEPKGFYLDKSERLAHINRFERHINKAIKLYEIAMHFDPSNGEHPFKIANFYDYLNIKYDSKDSYSLFLKAAECDPSNLYYKIGVIQSANAKNHTPPEWCAAGYGGLDASIIDMWYRNGERFQQAGARATGRLAPLID